MSFTTSGHKMGRALFLQPWSPHGWLYKTNTGYSNTTPDLVRKLFCNQKKDESLSVTPKQCFNPQFPSTSWPITNNISSILALWYLVEATTKLTFDKRVILNAQKGVPLFKNHEVVPRVRKVTLLLLHNNTSWLKSDSMLWTREL